MDRGLCPAGEVVGQAGGAFASIAGDLRREGFSIPQHGQDPAARLLVALPQPASLTIAAASSFALRETPAGQDRLVVMLWPEVQLADWERSRDAAIMAAFTRHSALAWARDRIRVNALTLAAAKTPHRAGIVSSIAALWRWRSMTGQIIHLDA